MKILIQNFECTQITYKLHTLQRIHGYLATNIFVLSSMATSLSLVEISQNVTTSFATTCALYSFVTKFRSIYNYKIKFKLI
jgi:hypothetical protein